MSKPLRIGLVVNHSYGYYRGVLRGIGRYAESKPDWLFTSIIPERSVQVLRRLRPDGLIASLNTKPLARALAVWRRPVVNVSAVLSGLRYPRVGVDNARVGELAAAHLLDRGLRHFGYVGPPDHQFALERRAAFCRIVEAAGYEVACHLTHRLPFDPLNRRWDLNRGVGRWLRALPTPVGVFVPSDDFGVQLAEACRVVELHVPDEVAILGVDDDDLQCELTRPRLSSVIVPAERIGFEAAALLDRLLGGDARPTKPVLLLPSGVATRKSTDTLAIDDKEVVAAVRYIRDHAHLPLGVTDVLKVVPVGRRALERRCHDALGWGLGAEIRRSRLERARRLLARTDLPMKTIAQQSGFSGFRHMAVAFGQELQMTPTAYRRSQRGPADQ